MHGPGRDDWPRAHGRHGSANDKPPANGEGPGSPLVRPYAVTGGRTKPRYQLQIEATVAEISAVLRMPLGVARVLIPDMAVEGLVRVHQLDHAHGRPDLNLLERVLSGLRKL